MPQEILATVQAEIRCLNLWNGSTNNAAPTNWNQPGFDDSAWPLSADPTIIDSIFRAHTTPPTPSTESIGSLPSGVEAIWPTTTMQSIYQAAVFRMHFDIPATYTLSLGEFFQPGSSGAVMEWWVNGVPQGFYLNQGFSPTNVEIQDASFFHTMFTAGSNLLAATCYPDTEFHAADGGLPPGSSTWIDQAWFAFQFTLDAEAAGRSWVMVVG